MRYIQQVGNAVKATRNVAAICCVVIALAFMTVLANHREGDANDLVSLSTVYHDWDSVAIAAPIKVDSSFISSYDWHKTVRYELDIMRRSKSYAEMEARIEPLITHAKYVVRISERYLTELHTFPDTVVLRDDTLIPSYPLPDIGTITWIVGTNDGVMHIVYRKGAGRGPIVHKTEQSCALDIDGITDNSYNYFGNLSYQNVVSIWTPSLKKHVYINGLRAIAGTEPYETGMVVPHVLHRIARIVTRHVCK